MGQTLTEQRRRQLASASNAGNPAGNAAHCAAGWRPSDAGPAARRVCQPTRPARTTAARNTGHARSGVDMAATTGARLPRPSRGDAARQG